MRYRTELMESILTNEMAQQIIDYVSPIYGDSYVGLWIYQAIGTILDDVYGLAEKLRYETSPATTELLLDYWEKHYGIPVNPRLTTSQRQTILIAKIQERGPINPTRLAASVSASLGGVPVDIVENIAKNTFLVIVREYVPLDPAYATLDRRKPAHLIYAIVVTVQTTVNVEKVRIGTAMTHKEKFELHCEPIRDFPPPDTQVKTAIALTYHEKTYLEVIET